MNWLVYSRSGKKCGAEFQLYIAVLRNIRHLENYFGFGGSSTPCGMNREDTSANAPIRELKGNQYPIQDTYQLSNCLPVLE